MKNSIQKKIDKVLDQVTEVQTGMTIAQLGLVKKIRLVEESRKLIVFLNRLGHTKACCATLNMAVQADIETSIKKGLESEFPFFSVSFTDG